MSWCKRLSTTSASLLERLKEAAPGSPDWLRLHDIYTPLIRVWLTKANVPPTETDDLIQEVLVVVVQEIAVFHRQRTGSFRAWLRNVVTNRVRTWWRVRHQQLGAGFNPTDQFLNQLEDPASHLSQQWDRDHDKHVFDKLLAIVRQDHEPATWEAFRLFAIEGRPASEVAESTGLTEGAVMSAKSRILKRLREEAAGLLDD